MEGDVRLLAPCPPGMCKKGRGRRTPRPRKSTVLTSIAPPTNYYSLATLTSRRIFMSRVEPPENMRRWANHVAKEHPQVSEVLLAGDPVTSWQRLFLATSFLASTQTGMGRHFSSR
jgi:hypothetical protein